jgi:hypothetical protein
MNNADVLRSLPNNHINLTRISRVRFSGLVIARAVMQIVGPRKGSEMWSLSLHLPLIVSGD